MRLTVLGLGLIGGSIARAAASAGWSVRAWTPSGDGPRAASRHGIVAAETLAEALPDAELILLAAPPLACLRLLEELSRPDRVALARGAVITDVASTKTAIVDRARASGLRFVGGHPLAGRERSGYAASDPELFVGRPWVIIPPDPPDTDAEERVEALALACGARVFPLSAAAHDEAVAAISHLPLLLSAALAESVSESAEWPVARELAAGGWASMTRLARGEPEMGAGILATNGAAVAERLDDLRAVLESWARDLRAGDPDAIRARLAAARAALGDDAG
jgi:prephenate dehydrogenase